MKAEDLRIEIFTNNSSEICMKILHMPTGITISGSGISYIKLRESLKKELEEAVEHFYKRRNDGQN